MKREGERKGRTETVTKGWSNWQENSFIAILSFSWKIKDCRTPEPPTHLAYLHPESCSARRARLLETSPLRQQHLRHAASTLRSVHVFVLAAIDSKPSTLLLGSRDPRKRNNATMVVTTVQWRIPRTGRDHDRSLNCLHTYSIGHQHRKVWTPRWRCSRRIMVTPRPSSGRCGEQATSKRTEMTEIVGTWIQIGLEAYGRDAEANWTSTGRDSVVYIFLDHAADTCFLDGETSCVHSTVWSHQNGTSYPNGVFNIQQRVGCWQ